MTKEHKIKSGANNSSITSAYSHETAIEIHPAITNVIQALRNAREQIDKCAELNVSPIFEDYLADMSETLTTIIFQSCDLVSSYIAHNKKVYGNVVSDVLAC